MIRPTSIIELNADALIRNIAFIKEKAGQGVEVLHVVKGNAYGHGLEQFVDLLQGLGIRNFGVFDAYEAYRIQQIAKPGCRIVIMGMIETSELEWAIRNEVEFFVFDPVRLEAAIDLSRKLNKNAIIHVELETGMHRTGFDEHQIDYLVNTFHCQRDRIKLSGICTHFAGAESFSNHNRIANQLSTFDKLKKYLQNEGVYPGAYHSACSAAMLRFPDSCMDMVRTGILQYGFWPSEELGAEHLQGIDKKEDPLKRVISWKSTVMSIKSVSKGAYIGYGNSFLASHDMTVASVPVGYSHGFSRSLSNQGRVLIHSERLPVIGMVNMNMMLVDVTNLSDVKPGDEVVLIGNQGDNCITVASFGDFSNQLNYELLTRLPADLPRVITGHHSLV